MSHPTHWTQPPSHDDALVWRFCEAESAIGIRSISEAMEAMALAGISTGGTIQTDDKFVRRRVVGVSTKDRGDIDIRLEHRERSSRDRESSAGKMRRIDAALAQLTETDRTVLYLAYGPEKWQAQIEQKLRPWPGVALLTKRAADLRTEGGRALEEWLRKRKENDPALYEMRRIAAEMVRESWNRYADVRGRRRSFARAAS